MARKKNTVGCLFYIALVLLLMVIFLFNRSTVQDVLEKTGFLKLFQKEEDTPVEVVIRPIDPEAEREPEAPGDKENQKIVVRIDDEEKVVENKRQEQSQSKMRKARLFFISVSDEGEINLKGVIRSVQYKDAPLQSTLESLLKGPLPPEINQGFRTLVSPDTRLLNIYIKDETAFLDFNEAFRFNSLGKEGLGAQLKQIVYTATEFSNIKKVQILIEGKITEYLGPEGIAIGKPLSRNSFRQ
ncbi:hypothetical protein ES703_108996 [subsurface metagenome]